MPLNELKRVVTIELLKSAAGRMIFCPSCGNGLDWKDAVLMTISGENSAAGISCGTCFDTQLARLSKRIGRTITVDDLVDTGCDVDDGRKL